MSAGKVAANDAYYQSYDNLGDTKRVTEATQEFNEETAKLQRAWTAIINQLAADLLPIMTAIVSAVRKFCDWLAKSRGFLVSLRALVAAIAVLLTASIAKSIISLITFLARVLTAEKKITAQKAIQAALSGPKGWVALASAGAVAGLVVPALMGSSGGGGGTQSTTTTISGDPFTSIKSENSISLEELKNGAKLSASQSFALAHSFGKVRDMAYEVADGFNEVNRKAGHTSDALKSIADNAISAHQMQYAAIVSTLSNSAQNNYNKNSSTTINTKIETNVTGNGVDDFVQAAKDAGLQHEDIIRQAAQRFA